MALSARQEKIVRAAALGHANKYLSYEFSTTASNLSANIKAAGRKLGVCSRAELFQLVRCQCGSELRVSLRNAEYLVVSYGMPDATALSLLTESERFIFDAVLAELSNAKIAALRGRSLHTIANQVAAVFRKLHAHSRSELVAKFSGQSAPCCVVFDGRLLGAMIRASPLPTTRGSG